MVNNYATLPFNVKLSPRFASVVRHLLFPAGYWCICSLGAASGATTGWSPLIWPATGFAFATLLLRGVSALPGLFVAGCLVRLPQVAPPAAATLSICDCLGVWMACALSRIIITDHDAPYTTTTNVLAFIFAGAPVGALFSGLAATLCFVLFARVPGTALLPFCITWMASCGAGIIIGAPAFWAWHQALTTKTRCLKKSQWLEPLVTAGCALVMSWHIFLRANTGVLSGYPLVFLFTPLFLWAALRFSFCALFTFQFFVGVCALAGSLHGMGPFETAVQQQSALLVQIYLIVLSGTGIIVYSVLAERKKTAATLEISKDVAIASLASLSETRDHETGAHIMRTRHYVRTLASHLRETDLYQDQLDDNCIDRLYKAAPLHDIGKIGVPDCILLKPGRLTAEEFKEIKKHTTFGRNVLRETREKLGPDPLIELAEEIAYTHHEKWDGSGYPRGLKAWEIPLSGRLMALADVYDALISKRIYKKPSSHLEAKEIILNGAGSHFDPDIVNAFIRKEHEFVRIAWEYADEE